MAVNFKICNRGSSRWVVLAWIFALKFARSDYGVSLFMSGVKSNIKEYKTRNNHPKFLAPYISILGLVNISPRCQQFKGYIPESWMRTTGLYKMNIEIKDDNFGVYNNKLVCLDYGVFRDG